MRLRRKSVVIWRAGEPACRHSAASDRVRISHIPDPVTLPLCRRLNLQHELLADISAIDFAVCPDANGNGSIDNVLDDLDRND